LNANWPSDGVATRQMTSKILTFVDASVLIRETYQADLSSLCTSLVYLLRRFS
jgi:hypothetical protein